MQVRPEPRHFLRRTRCGRRFSLGGLARASTLRCRRAAAGEAGWRRMQGERLVTRRSAVQQPTITQAQPRCCICAAASGRWVRWLAGSALCCC